MDQFLLNLIQATLLLFVAMDTIGNIPPFLILTKKMRRERRRKNITTALIVASALLILFLIFGQAILDIFSISLRDFKIAGGIILAIIGIRFMLNLRLLEERAEKYQNAIVPMATPLITGPATITTIIINTSSYGFLISAIAAAANLIFAWIVLRNVDFFFKLFGRQGTDLLSRIFGLLLVAIGIGYIRAGM